MNISELEARIRTAENVVDKVDAMHELSREYMYRGRIDDAIRLCKESFRLASKESYVNGMIRSRIRRSDIYARSSDFERALAEVAKALDLLHGNQDRHDYHHDYAAVRLAEANVRLLAGDYAEAAVLAQEHLPYLESIGDEKNQVVALGVIAYAFGYLGDIPSALEFYHQSLALRERIDSRRAVAVAYYHIGRLYSDLCEPETALKYLHQALAIFQDENNVPGRAQVLNTIGNAHKMMEKYEAALECFHESIRLKESIGDRLGAATSLMNIGIVHNDTGRYAEALECYGRVNETIEDLRYTGPIASSLYLNLGTVSVATGRREEALDWFLKALANAEAIGQKRVMAEVHADCATLYEEQGDVQRALDHFRRFYQIDQEIAGEQISNRVKAFTIKREVEQANREKDAAIREAEVYRLKSENLELEMRLRNNELAMLAMNLTRKDGLLETILLQIDDLSRIDDPDELRRTVAGIAGEIRQGGRSDGSWQTFEEQFRLLHPDFVTTLVGHYPSLTPTEIKICSLLRIGLSTKEIADLLNVTGGNVDMHRTRIRRKLGLDPGTNLVSCLAAL